MSTARIDARFAALKAEGRAAFVAYLMAGDPDAETAAKILAGLPAAGADIIELGFPFSDPMAEGPPIQRAAQRALARGMTLKGVLDQVIAAVEFLFLFTLVSGVLVLYAALVGSQDERIREAGLLRALGATRSQLSQAQRIEFVLVGALAGVLAASGAAAVGWTLARYVFNFEWTFSPFVWLAGLVAGALCAFAGGWVGLRNVLRQPPLQTLRGG